MYAVTANEKSDLTQWERRQDVALIYATLPTEPIVLWQEMRKPEHHADVIHKAPAGTQHLFGPDANGEGHLPIPISVPARYAIHDRFWVRAKPWTGATTEGPGLGPVGDWPRYYAGALVQDQNNPLQPAFWVVNTHMTNGCEWDSATPSDTALALRPYWTDHWGFMQADLAAITGADQTVVWGGDTNRKDFPGFHLDDKYAHGKDPARIDKLVIRDRSVTSVLKATGSIATRSDHQARWAKWDLAKA